MAGLMGAAAAISLNLTKIRAEPGKSRASEVVAVLPRSRPQVKGVSRETDLDVEKPAVRHDFARDRRLL